METTLERISLAKIRENPKNPNVVPADILEKIERNIKRTGHYPPLIVRPIGEGSGEFMLIDGRHRRLILQRLGHEDATCMVWDVTEREADVMLATLNNLHGQDNPRKRAELIDELARTIPIPQLAQIIPESEAQIVDLQKLLQVDMQSLDSLARSIADRNDAETPVRFEVLLFPGQLEVVRRALEHVKATELDPKAKNPDGQALEAIAADYLAGAKQINA